MHCTFADLGSNKVLLLLHGGLAVLWRKTLGCVKTKKYSDRIYGIELTGSDKLVILNVYLPYDNNSFESLDNFRQILGEISAIVQDGNANELVIVMGDFNADFKGALYRIWCCVNRLGDSGVKVVLIDTAIFQLLLSRRRSHPGGWLLLTRRGKTRMYTVGIVFEFYTVPL